MTLLVTGANGFLGSYVVAQALRLRHRVRAVVRPGRDVSALPWADHPDVQIVRLDLNTAEGIDEALDDVSAVIHLAAAKSGDFDAQFRGTVITTEHLLDAMRRKQVRRLIAISTFSVYDYLHLRQGKLVTEESPLERKPDARDEYARTKLLQEQLVREFEQNDGGKVTVLRPGVIFGRGNTWTSRLGMAKGNRWIRIGANAPLPLVYVENCAEAIVLAARIDAAIGQTINLVDDQSPTQRQYIDKLRQHMTSRPTIVPINWTAMRTIARLAAASNRLLLGNRARLPGLLIPARLHARCKPLRYTNAKMKQVLGYTPRYDLDTALDRAFSDVALLVVNRGDESPHDPQQHNSPHDKESSGAFQSPI